MRRPFLSPVHGHGLSHSPHAGWGTAIQFTRTGQRDHYDVRVCLLYCMQLLADEGRKQGEKEGERERERHTHTRDRKERVCIENWREEVANREKKGHFEREKGEQRHNTAKTCPQGDARADMGPCLGPCFSQNRAGSGSTTKSVRGPHVFHTMKIGISEEKCGHNEKAKNHKLPTP